MNDQLLESLLYRSEDPSVDYKMEQYVFTREDIAGDELSKPERARMFEEKKSELLKDILAMANAWTDGPRYILLGFKENKPSVPTVVGIAGDRLHDDAAFQQFIGSRVNTPLQFKYEVQEFRSVTVGIITIAKQRRPFFAKEQYGVVQRGVVYVRHGSSTAIADPSEIAFMGSADSGTRAEANVAVELTSRGVELAGTEIPLKNPLFGSKPLPDYAEKNTGPLGMALAGLNGRANENYWRQLRAFVETRMRAIPIQIEVRNGSEFALTHCELHVQATMDDAPAKVQMGDNEPDVPSTNWEVGNLIGNFRRTGVERKTVELDDDGRGAIARFDRILPGAKERASDLLSVLPERSGQVRLACTLYASDLKEPRRFLVEFTVVAEDESWDFERLVELHKQLP